MMYEYNATIIRVIDGDTVILALDLGCDIVLHVSCRLYGPDPGKPWGINAPELNTPEGKAAKEFLCSLLQPGFEVVARTIKDRREKYGRYLCVIYLADGTGRCANEELVKAGHAVLKAY